MLRTTLMVAALSAVALPGAAQQPHAHPIRLIFTGHWGAWTGPPSEVCPQTSRTGTDSYEGTVSSVLVDGETVHYEGIVKRLTRIDSCETAPLPGKGEDEVDFCTVSVSGTAEMQLKLTMYVGEDEMSVQTTPLAPYGTASTSGNCPPAWIAEAKVIYPDDIGVGIPGVPFGALRAGSYRTPMEDAGQWVLEIGPRQALPSAPSRCYVDPVSKITLTPNPARVAVEASLRIAVEVLDGQGRPVRGACVDWQTSDEDVATVRSNGTVQGVASGRATITATVGRAQTSVVVIVF